MSSKRESPKTRATLLHNKLNFSATEAYKLLRTNLMFTLPPDKKCRIIGVTSAGRGEGKSTTSINVSCALSETGKRVLLIDGDLRLPSVARKMDISLTPGLSNALVGAVSLQTAISESEVCANWHILPAGDIPPNPTELLGSGRMKKLLEALEDAYDFIVIDLPPVNIVSDALVVAPMTDGMVVVVRENYTTRRALNNCTSHLALSGAKILGFVMNDTTLSPHSYGRYKRYGHYGRNEQNAYEKAAKKLRKQNDD